MRRRDVVASITKDDAFLRALVRIPDNLTMKRCWGSFIGSKPRMSNSYRAKLKVILGGFGADSLLPIKEIDRAVIKRAVAGFSERQADVTFKGTIEVLRAFFGYCISKGWYVQMPLVPFVITERPEKQFFTPERLNIIAWRAGAGKLRDALGVMYYTGASADELWTLKRHYNGWCSVGGRVIKETPALAGILDKCPRYRSSMVVEKFRRLMKELDFEGRLEHLSNSYYARLYVLGAPPSVIKRVSGLLHPGAKIDSLCVRGWRQDQPFEDFF